MVMKRVFFILFAVMVLFSFTSSLLASDLKTEDQPEVATEVKSEESPEVKSAKEADVTAVKKININKATAVELSAGLKKVGPKYAAAIVKYREENGEFKAPEEIKNVKGIGDKIFELNKDVIVIKD